MTDSYDTYDEKLPHQQSSLERLWTSFLKFIGVKKTPPEEDYVVFEYAGVEWGGFADGNVSPHPMCPNCGTQLSFTSKDMVMCDCCHKYKNQVGEFNFKLNTSVITFEKAFAGASEKWKEIFTEYYDIME